MCDADFVARVEREAKRHGSAIALGTGATQYVPTRPPPRPLSETRATCDRCGSASARRHRDRRGHPGSPAGDVDRTRHGHAPRLPRETSATADSIEDGARDRATLLEGFDRHYALFRECARAAKRHFEAGNWLAIQHVARRPHRFLRPPRAGDRRADRARVRARRHRRRRRRRAVGAGQAALHRPPDRPQAARVRRDVLQLGLGEDRCAARYFHNRFIFVRPAISTEHIDADPPSYRSYYPLQQGLRHALIDIVLDFALRAPLRGFRPRPAQRARRVPPPLPAAVPRSRPTTRSRCCRRRSSATRPRTSSGASSTARTRIRSSCRSSTTPHGKLYLDALLMDEVELAILFSANRAYFLVDMEVPSAYVDFLRAIAAGQDGRRALHDGRAAEGRQEPLLPRLPAPSQALARQVHHRARHQGPRDDACSRCRRIPTCSR